MNYLPGDVKPEGIEKGAAKYGQPSDAGRSVIQNVGTTACMVCSIANKVEDMKKTDNGYMCSLCCNHAGVDEPGQVLGIDKVENDLKKNEDSSALGYDSTQKTTTAKRLEDAAGKPGQKNYHFVDVNGEEEAVTAPSLDEAWDRLANIFGTHVSELKRIGIKFVRENDVAEEAEEIERHVEGIKHEVAEIKENMPDGTLTDPEHREVDEAGKPVMTNDSAPDRTVIREGVLAGDAKYGHRKNYDPHGGHKFKPGDRVIVMLSDGNKEAVFVKYDTNYGDGDEVVTVEQRGTISGTLFKKNEQYQEHQIKKA